MTDWDVWTLASTSRRTEKMRGFEAVILLKGSHRNPPGWACWGGQGSASLTQRASGVNETLRLVGAAAGEAEA
jgi:hypothetical protein